MKANPSECQKQAGAESEANIHKASFVERRLFYPAEFCVFMPVLDMYVVRDKSKLCYMGTR